MTAGPPKRARADKPAIKSAAKLAAKGRPAPARKDLAGAVPLPATGAAAPLTRSPARRNAAATRQRILEAAMAEFSDHGFSGSRIDRICATADVNVGMIYHYFGNKDDLYLAALEASYKIIRELEQTLDVNGLDPVTAMRRLIEMTFDFLAGDPHFVRLIMNENLMMGRTARRSQTIPHLTQPLLSSLRTILKRGQTLRVFHKDIDAENLYVSILGLSFIHVSNRHTLGTMFQQDFAASDWLAKRRAIVVDILTSYLSADPG
ncbi:TetR/AcrR family transcriptional regulator [Xanthobacter tagetidis]|jgi:AcrR family transcriptional regulator|uniref:TetR/AcrR family transcriptional regulator n=1 Tax=Xanthobacter tagetidis TaxID=60216 RepID=A0A3L7AFC5_9HYPH|nr:TetR/AcrR family transcriptional regulator [Xanthobacter tagetidis]